MNKLDRIVMEALSKDTLAKSVFTFDPKMSVTLGEVKRVAQVVAKASFDETNHFVEKLLDDVEDLIEGYVDDARWMSWIKKKRKKWEKLKEGFGVGNG